MAHARADNRYTRGLAEFVSGLRYERIPEEVRERLKLLMLDSLGCALFGAGLEWSRILRRSLSAVDTSRGSILWGTAERLSAPHAALVNGTAVQGFELDDVHRQGVLHVGAVTLPALFATVETMADRNAGTFSGRDLLRAAVAGYEVGPRVGMCMGQEHIGQGWHSGATVGVFSAAAGAAAALGLSADETVHALGIAGTQSAGLMAAQYGAMVKRMHAGRSSQSGLYGALLAREGFTGIVDVFESEYGGFCSTFSRSHDRFNLEELTAGLGERWETMRISLKFYSCVGSNHTTLDAIRAVQGRASVRAWRCRAHRRARLAGDDGPRRLEVPARGPHLRPAEFAVLRGHPADRGRLLRRPVHGGNRRRQSPHGAGRTRAGPPRRRHHRARLEVPPHGPRRGAPEGRHPHGARRSRHRAAANSPSPARPTSSPNSRSSPPTPSPRRPPGASPIWC